jgi:hypothetical protein
MKQLIAIVILCLTVSYGHANEKLIQSFVGVFKGEAEISQSRSRSLQVVVKRIKDGFNVSWKTITLESSGSGKTKSYSIDFIASDRKGIFGSAMKTNLFGGQEPLDPMKGEPYFWARLNEKTLTIYGMLINEEGNYEVQRYDRTLEGNDMLVKYTLTRSGDVVKTITATLTRQE